MLQIYDGSAYTEIRAPQNNKFEEIIVTTTIDSQKTYLFVVNIHKGIDTYVDDIRVLLQ